MRKKRVIQFLTLAVLGTGCGLLKSESENARFPHHVFFHLEAAASVSAPLNGRLLIFMKKGTGDKEVNAQEFSPEATWVAAQEIHDLAPGESVEVDADQIAFPQPFSAMPAGDYEAQAVLDVDHTYNYSGRGPQDWISDVTPLLQWNPDIGREWSLKLHQHPTENVRRAAMRSKMMSRAEGGTAEKVEFVSPSLSQFWGHPVAIRAWVILPPGYSDGRKRYPTVYWTHGFGGNLEYSLFEGMNIYDRMKQGKMPPMIWVMLDESVPQGTHEFADSVNNGPWGEALTTEFLPYLERKFRMDARRNGRFLNGHSSGGWATLQLQVNYPQLFGGTWSTSPDSSDFRDFTGPDLYASGANLYKRPDGTPWPIMRENGKVVATLEQFAKLEAVLGPYGGQISSFEWVFSPRGKDGAPQAMFDRKTGAVDSRVVGYWRDHYDLSHIVEANWAERGRDLKGRIHLLVGTADTFYLDGAARKFEAVLKRLDAEPHFSYLPNKTHFNLYTVGDDREGLYTRISEEMYAVARPGKDWKKE